MNPVAYSGRNRLVTDSATGVLFMARTLHRRSAARARGQTRERPAGLPAGRRMSVRLGGKTVHGRIQGFHAYPRRLGLGHAEALIDIQRLPEKNPRGIGSPGAERRFRDPFENLALLVGIPDLPGQLQHGMVLVEGLVVAARCAAHVGYPAPGDDLLGLV